MLIFYNRIKLPVFGQKNCNPVFTGLQFFSFFSGWLPPIFVVPAAFSGFSRVLPVARLGPVPVFAFFLQFYNCYRVLPNGETDTSAIYIWEHELFEIREVAKDLIDLIKKYYNDEI